MKYKVNPKFNDTKDIVVNVQHYFDDSEKLLQNARNQIKSVLFKDINYAVKSFRKPSGISCLLYSFFRISKAKRSYDYSLKIAEFVPQAIGYVELYDGAFLTKSFFISELFEYDFTIREVLLNKTMINREELLKQFASFSFDLHEEGIFHKDFSPGNILIKQGEPNYQFKIIDINRMHFGELTITDRMRNFSMLWASDSDLEIISTHYANLAQLDVNQCKLLASKFNKRNKQIKNFKKRLKGKPVND
jgi:RIO-like serine/threonine protein kinase